MGRSYQPLGEFRLKTFEGRVFRVCLPDLSVRKSRSEKSFVILSYLYHQNRRTIRRFQDQRRGRLGSCGPRSQASAVNDRSSVRLSRGSARHARRLGPFATNETPPGRSGRQRKFFLFTFFEEFLICLEGKSGDTFVPPC